VKIWDEFNSFLPEAGKGKIGCRNRRKRSKWDFESSALNHSATCPFIRGRTRAPGANSSLHRAIFFSLPVREENGDRRQNPSPALNQFRSKQTSA
jgi:hypothetical protein